MKFNRGQALLELALCAPVVPGRGLPIRAHAVIDKERFAR